MASNNLNRLWLLATFILIIIIISGSLFIWIRRDHGQPLLIVPPPSPQLNGNIYIEGAVVNPGLYPLQDGDTVNGLIQASGGLSEGADPHQVHLYVPQATQITSSQMININRADAWLLEALPGIGDVRAQAIVDYREDNGPFRSIQDVTKVPGISDSTFDKIKDFITVKD
jgi:competence protein ComEA